MANGELVAMLKRIVQAAEDGFIYPIDPLFQKNLAQALARADAEREKQKRSYENRDLWTALVSRLDIGTWRILSWDVNEAEFETQRSGLNIDLRLYTKQVGEGFKDSWPFEKRVSAFCLSCSVGGERSSYVCEGVNGEVRLEFMIQRGLALLVGTHAA